MATVNRYGGAYGSDLHAQWIPVVGSSIYLAVTTADQDFGDMAANTHYIFTATVAVAIKQGTAAPVTAAFASGSMVVPAGLPVLIDSADGVVLACIGAAAGHATLQKVKPAK